MTAEQLATARGCVLGLMLGDAIGATGGNVPACGPLLATSAGQLACFTIDGLIRAHIRGMHKGICHPPGRCLAAIHPLGCHSGHPWVEGVGRGGLAERLAGEGPGVG